MAGELAQEAAEARDARADAAAPRPKPVAGTRRRRWFSPLPWILPLVLLALWQASLSFGWVKPYQLTPPLDVLASAGEEWRRGVLQSDIIATVVRVLAGFAIGAAVAVLLGLVTGLSRRAHQAMEPTLQALRSIPTLAWGPLLLLWLGITDVPKILLVAIGAFFPVYVNLVAGIHGVDRKLIEVARIYNLGWLATARRVILPAATPSLFTGLRLGISQAWLFVVVAEIFGATKGLGFRLTDSQQSTRVDLMLVAMLTLAVLGKIADTIVVAIERRALSWRDSIGTEEGL
ncbi:MAG TPA: ABC transporter permease [Nonomuraea sp.]|nr:ABC transporter permease [Nonomuraea sp.]